MCSPKSDKKNHNVVVFCPIRTFRSVLYFNLPLLFSVPLTFSTGLGLGSCLMGSRSQLAYARFMKFSVAPKSRSAMNLALFATE